LSLSEISNSLGFHKSTAHHILKTLLPFEYVYQYRDTKKYALGYRFLEISKGILNNIDVRKVANGHLRRLQGQCNETVHLAILRNGKVIYIDKIDSTSGLSLVTYVGFTTEPHAVAAGKVLLSEMTPEEVRGLFGNRALKTYGTKTITTVGKLLEHLGTVKDQGYAIDDEEHHEGVRCVAAPVRAGGKIVAALSVTGSIFTMTPERIHGELIKMAVKTAEGISREMRHGDADFYRH
jgi:DNA-binding IclR family transcriptional regulator